jgi:MYXO-CTERM domain-containing protein
VISAAAEQSRVTAHLEHAERFALERDLSSLDSLRQLTRELLLSELASYRAAGRFPKNPGFSELTPTFVDAEGTRCAMAHLLEVGGERDLVAKIAAERNYARVKELADEPLLLAWLDAAGLTVEEAATIQPSYSCTTPVGCVCGAALTGQDHLPVPAKGVLQAVVLNESTARVELAFGETALKPGDVFPLSAGAVGTKVIIGLDATQAATLVAHDGGAKTPGYVPYVALGADEKFVCKPGLGGGMTAPGLTAAQYAQIVMAPNCKAEARRLPGFEAETCGPGGGCSSAVGGAPMSLGVLLAVVGVLIARRPR